MGCFCVLRKPPLAARAARLPARPRRSQTAARPAPRVHLPGVAALMPLGAAAVVVRPRLVPPGQAHDFSDSASSEMTLSSNGSVPFVYELPGLETTRMGRIELPRRGIRRNRKTHILLASEKPYASPVCSSLNRSVFVNRLDTTRCSSSTWQKPLASGEQSGPRITNGGIR